MSKFSKVNLFSGLNNLEDITLDARYSAPVQLPDEDVDTVFSPSRLGWTEEIRRWYSGLQLAGPGCTTLRLAAAVSQPRSAPTGLETGTPTFLIKLLTETEKQFTPDLTASWPRHSAVHLRCGQHPARGAHVPGGAT